jgi:LPS export ABC transporter protein LptC
MHQAKRFPILPVIIGAVAGVLVAVVVLMQTGPLEREEALDSAQRPLVEMEGVSLTQWNEAGEKVWTLKADSAQQYTDTTVLRQAFLTLFEEDKPVSAGSANLVSVNNGTSDFDLEGDITVLSYRDRTSLSTQQLHWDAEERKMYSDGDVTVKRGELLIQGRGLEAQPDLSQITIFNQVTSYLKGDYQ